MDHFFKRALWQYVELPNHHQFMKLKLASIGLAMSRKLKSTTGEGTLFLVICMHPATNWFRYLPVEFLYIYIYIYPTAAPPNANHSFIHSFMIVYLLYVATSAHFPISIQKKQKQKKGGEAPVYTSKQKPIHFVIYSTKVHI